MFTANFNGDVSQIMEKNKMSFNLKDHGDTYERKWGEIIIENFPNYETLWSKHTAPLTCRIHEPKNIYMRIEVNDVLRKFGSSSWGIFVELSEAHKLLNEGKLQTEFIQFGEFISHIYKCLGNYLDSFIRDTNKVLEHYNRVAIQRETRFGSLENVKGELLKSINPYRTQAQHFTPPIIIGNKVPKSNFVENYQDQGMISEFVSSDDFAEIFEAQFINIGELCEKLLKQVENNLNDYWSVIINEFDSLLEIETYINDQKSDGAKTIKFVEDLRVGFELSDDVESTTFITSSGIININSSGSLGGD